MIKFNSHDAFIGFLKQNNPTILEDYDFLGKYENNNTKLLVLHKYGKMNVSPKTFILGSSPDIRSACDKTSWFINRVKDDNFEFFKKYKIVGEYIDTRTPILIRGKYGDLNVLPLNILNSQDFSILSAINKTEYWTNMAIEKHGDKFDYSNVVYIDSSTKIMVKCNIHDYMFVTIPNEHLRMKFACRLCANELNESHKSCTHDDFIEKLKQCSIDYYNTLTLLTKYKKNNSHMYAFDGFGLIKFIPNNLIKKVSNSNFDYSAPSIASAISKNDYALAMIKYYRDDSGSRYNYSKFAYNGSRKKSIFICEEHGEFEQEFWSHLRGSGCPKCALELQGWSCSDWIRCANNSTNFDAFKLYMIKCWNENEEFYKIGITYKKIKVRFGGVKAMPYKYDIVDVISSDDGEYIWHLEKKLHNEHKAYKYEPNIEFGGMGECFSKLKKIKGGIDNG